MQQRRQKGGPKKKKKRPTDRPTRTAGADERGAEKKMKTIYHGVEVRVAWDKQIVFARATGLLTLLLLLWPHVKRIQIYWPLYNGPPGSLQDINCNLL